MAIARFQGFRIPIGGGDLGCTTRFEYEQMFDLGEIEIAQPDISMAGGFTEVKRIADRWPGRAASGWCPMATRPTS